MFGLDFGIAILLILSLLFACVFEFINGFHDTANAVATVIYTKSLKPKQAVIWSGIWNFLGVYLGGIAVAMGIMSLLPLNVLMGQDIYLNISLILTLIITAIIWNVGTWYLGIPCSSSHTLLGSIFGAGLAISYVSNSGFTKLPWTKLQDAGLSLLISPVVGFGLAILLMFIFKKLVNKKKFFDSADEHKKPPFWIRGLLVLTCTSVSYSHGSNDGQKGMGLIMIILICFLPAKFSLDPSKNPANMIGNVQYIEYYLNKIDVKNIPAKDTLSISKAKKSIVALKAIVVKLNTPEVNASSYSFEIRKNIMQIESSSKIALSCKNCFDKNEMDKFKSNIKELKAYTEFVPWWVIAMVSISLGIGTMIGWKRIVVTIGEKIGKTHLNYAQGASAEIIAASTIGFSTWLGLPVSTTHVLSSGIGGSMVYQGGLKNLQGGTVKNILLTWLITIPVTVILSASLFLLIKYIIK